MPHSGPAGGAKPTLSVVIPTCNRPELLAQCLDATLSAIALTDVHVDIHVSDDSADEASRHLVAERYPAVQWHQGPRRGPAANRNTAVAASRADWIVFTDDDCIPESEWLAAFLRAIQSSPGHRLFEGRTVADRERRRLDEESPVNESGGYLWSCNMAISRELFDELRGFCEDFPYAAMEDVDLRLRLAKQGHVARFVSEAIVCHPIRPAKGLRFVARTGESYAHLAARHPELLGRSPWRAFVLTAARRTAGLSRDAWHFRGRGLGYGLAVLYLGIRADFRARRRLVSAGQ